MPRLPRPGITGALILAAASAAISVPVRSAECDRACLERAAGRYWTAMLSHDPSRLNTTPGLKFTENGVVLHPGEALWRTVSRTKPRALTFTDPERGVVVTSGLVTEGGRPALLIARLAAPDGAVREIETLVARPETSPFLSPTGWYTSGALLLRSLVPAARRGREELVRIVESYFDRLADPKKPLPPFDARCNRVENGVQTTNNAEPFPGVHPAPLSSAVSRLGCAEQFALGTLSFVSRVRERRYVLADESKGLVLAFATFDHDGTLPAPGAHGTLSTGLASPYSYLVAELFKIDGGRIRHIQAIITQVPYGMRSPW